MTQPKTVTVSPDSLAEAFEKFKFQNFYKFKYGMKHRIFDVSVSRMRYISKTPFKKILTL